MGRKKAHFLWKKFLEDLEFWLPITFFYKCSWLQKHFKKETSPPHKQLLYVLQNTAVDNVVFDSLSSQHSEYEQPARIINNKF